MSAKEDLFNYVIESPENTNPAVLKSLINAPDLKEVETIELTSEEAQRLLSQSGATIQTVGGRDVHDIMEEVQNGKPIPILKLPYDRPSLYTNACDCRFIGKDSSPDAQQETLMWTLVTKTEGIQNTGKGYFYSTIQNEPSSNLVKVYYITYPYNANFIRLQTK